MNCSKELINNKVGVVVLNYKAFNETIQCVDSILLQKGVVPHIIIVDNNSLNESIGELKKRYDIDNRVEIIESGENLGFARGNNLGICELVSQGYEYIFLANSDLLFSSDNIIADMISCYQKSEDTVGIINPLVLNPDKSQATFIYFKKKYMRLRMIKTFVEAFFKRMKEFLGCRKDKLVKDNDILDLNNINVASNNKTTSFLVHRDYFKIVGCAYMYTPEFFRYYNQMYPKTFLYGEEYCTALYLDAAGLCTMEVDTDAIIHLGGRSTSSNVKRSKYVRKTYNKAVLELIFTKRPEILSKYGRKDDQ